MTRFGSGGITRQVGSSIAGGYIDQKIQGISDFSSNNQETDK